MEDLDRRFRDGDLAGRLDGSTFRPLDAGRTVRGRSWAIHDGILGEPWPELHMALLAALKETQAKRPKFRYAALFESLPTDWPSIFARTGANALHLAAKHVSAREADELNTLGIVWACYSVNTVIEATRLFGLGCAAVFTDRPDLWSPEAM